MNRNFKINFSIAVLILSMNSVHCGSSFTSTRIYEGPYRGTNSNNNAVVVGRATDKEDNTPLVYGIVIIAGSSFS